MKEIFNSDWILNQEFASLQQDIEEIKNTIWIDEQQKEILCQALFAKFGKKLFEKFVIHKESLVSNELLTVMNDQSEISSNQESFGADIVKLKENDEKYKKFLDQNYKNTASLINKSEADNIIKDKEYPEFVNNFRLFLIILNADMRKFYDNIVSDELQTLFKPMIEDNFRIENVLKKFADKDRFKNMMGIKDMGQFNDSVANRKMFFEKCIDSYFKNVLNGLSAVYAYSKIKDKSINLVRAFDFGELDKLIDKMYQDIGVFFLMEYDVNLQIVELFAEKFNSKLFVKKDISSAENIDSTYSNAIKNLEEGVIYDMNAVWIHSNLLGIDKKPEVVIKIDFLKR